MWLGVSESDLLYCDHLVLDQDFEFLAQEAGYPLVEPVKAGEHRVARRPAGGRVRLYGMEARESGVERFATLPKHGHGHVVVAAVWFEKN